jgi:hypothetical protein
MLRVQPPNIIPAELGTRFLWWVIPWFDSGWLETGGNEGLVVVRWLFAWGTLIVIIVILASS